MNTEKLNTFTIAHYILLFLVVVLCVGIVAWTVTQAANSMPGRTNNANAITERVD